jgi:hypothetical protein
MATYSATVERWRPLVEKYFPPELVDKALYVIQGESGGNPTIRGDGGVAIGLFQIQDNRNFSTRPSAEWLENPENNIKYAAQQLGAASGKWSDWGEGSTYNGQAFGALGHNPYPGDNGDYSGNRNTWDSSMNPEVTLPFSQEEYDQKLARYIYLETYLNSIDPNLPPPDMQQMMQEYSQLAADIMRFDAAKAEGGAHWDNELARLEYLNENDPRRIDALNAANRWAREQSLNQQAMADTANEMAQQRLNQESAEESGNSYRSQSVFSGPMSFRVASTDLPTEEEVFADAISKASRNLPEVPDLPYAQPLPSAFGKAPSYTSPTPQPNGGGTSIFDSTKPSSIRDQMAAQFNQATMAGKTAGFMDRAFGSGFSQNPDTTRPPLFQAPSLITNNNVGATATPRPTPSVFSGPPVATRTPVPYNQPQAGLYGSARRFVGSLFGGR